MQKFWQDLRYGLRMLRKNPGFAFAVILTLGLGIGLNSAIFTAANGFLLRDPPVKHARTVVMVSMANPSKALKRNPATATEFRALHGESHLFEDAAAVQLDSLPLTGRGTPENVAVARVSPNYFALLGVPAHLGRTFTPDINQADQKFSAIISFDLWQRRFNADSGVIGNTLTLAGQIYSVIGIMPEQFKYAFVPCDVWIPGSFVVQPLSSAQSENRHLNVFARLRPGTTPTGAEVQTNTIIQRLAHDNPAEKGWVTNVLTLQAALVEEGTRFAVLFLMGVVVFVLLIACANVAGMFLARHAGRVMEFSVRQALGAGRLRLIQQLLGESLPFAIFGGAASAKDRMRVLFAFLAGTGLRIGEALGLKTSDLSSDWRIIRIERSIWRGQEQLPKTANAIRAVDVPEALAQVLRSFVAGRNGYLFATAKGRPLQHRNVLRALHGTKKIGLHAFRRFRLTWLRKNGVPKDLEHFWMGHADEEIGDLYSKLKEDEPYRQHWAERIGLGFSVGQLGPLNVVSIAEAKVA